MAAEARRVSLYGLEFVLPEGMTDWTDYAFEASDSPLQQVSFADEPQADPEAWLNYVRDTLAGWETAKVMPIRDFEHTGAKARGFETRFGDDPNARRLATVAIPRKNGTLAVRAKGVPGYLDVVEHILRTLRPGRAPLGHPLYSVYDLYFESPAKLEPPREFLFESADQKARLTVSRTEARPVFADPEWSAAYVFPRDAKLEVLERVEGSSVNPPPEAPLVLETYRVDVRAVPAPEAPPPASSEELSFACARTELPNAHQLLELRSQLGFAASQQLFESILASVQREH